MLETIVLLLRAGLLWFNHRYDPHQVHLRELAAVRELKDDLKEEAEYAIAMEDTLALSLILKKHKKKKKK